LKQPGEFGVKLGWLHIGGRRSGGVSSRRRQNLRRVAAKLHLHDARPIPVLLLFVLLLFVLLLFVLFVFVWRVLAGAGLWR